MYIVDLGLDEARQDWWNVAHASLFHLSSPPEMLYQVPSEAPGNILSFLGPGSLPSMAAV